MKFDFRNIDWLSPKPSKERIVLGLAVLAVGAGAYALGTHRVSPTSQAVPAMPVRDDDPAGQRDWKALEPQADSYGQDGEGGLQEVRQIRPLARGPGPVPLKAMQGGQCRTFAPEGWRIVDQNRDGTVFTLRSGDGRMLASYAGAAIGAGQAAGYYGPQFRTPETFALYAAGVVTGEQAQAAGPAQPVGPYRAIQFRTATRQGYILLYRFRVPDPGGFGVVMRIAAAPAGDLHATGVAGAVATATRCAATVHPPTGPVWHAPREEHGAGSTGRGGGGDIVGDYNAQLGTGWVHDDAGNNYNVDVAGDWSENGPDGPGFYKRNGNDGTKLQPGLS